jgi:hypothetical protein
MVPTVFGISDLHLSFARPKPMDRFGAHWANHAERIAAAWRGRVTEEDIVLVGGDVSWATRLPEAVPDLQWIGQLPGRKILVRGNHDYWWSTIGKVRAVGPDGMHFIQNDVVCMDGVALGGARLWEFPDVSWPMVEVGPNEPDASPMDRLVGAVGGAPGGMGRPSPEQAERIRERELLRLQMSLQKYPTDALVRIALVHFPPIGAVGESTILSATLDEFGVDVCVFGHLHPRQPGILDCFERVVGRTRYVLTSCDTIGFAPLRIWPTSVPT